MDTFKYLLWVPGNCASLRMAAQLLSDAAVLKLDSPELEWYYPLLTPYSEYIPVRCEGRRIPKAFRLGVRGSEQHAVVADPKSLRLQV